MTDCEGRYCTVGLKSPCADRTYTVGVLARRGTEVRGYIDQGLVERVRFLDRERPPWEFSIGADDLASRVRWFMETYSWTMDDVRRLYKGHVILGWTRAVTLGLSELTIDQFLREETARWAGVEGLPPPGGPWYTNHGAAAAEVWGRKTGALD